MKPHNAHPAGPKVTCPTCGRLQVYSVNNAFRPFCSERCKMIDLGQWANENYRVPVSEERPDPESSMPD